jgi:malic enzyme
MENIISQNEDYENLLKKNRGLLQVNCKIPVKDRTALAQVYTPGVGYCCKLIEKNPQRAYDLTNKKNACIVISDGSEFGLRPEEVYPYLEAFCAYYKISANIDAYPIIIDGSLIKNSDDFQATVKAIMPAFSFVEFYGVKEIYLKGFCSEGKFSFFNSNLKRKIDESLIKRYDLILSIKFYLKN